MAEGAILGVDPGTSKCGLAVVDSSGEVSYRAVVALENLSATARALAAQRALGRLALGNRTGAQRVRALLEEALPEIPVEVVPEHRTTEEARRLYREYHPPRGWRRLVPRGMLVPPEPVDGFAAEILARRLEESAGS